MGALTDFLVLLGRHWVLAAVACVELAAAVCCWGHLPAKRLGRSDVRPPRSALPKTSAFFCTSWSVSLMRCAFWCAAATVCPCAR